jgi:hypothetical protein
MRFFIALSLAFFAVTASANTITFWGGKNNTRHATSSAACKSYHYTYEATSTGPTTATCATPGYSIAYTVTQNTNTCPYGSTGFTCNTVAPTCEYGTFDANTNSCPAAPVDACAGQAGISSTWQKTYSSYAAYSPIYETTSQGGCGMTVGAMECGSSATGEFSCWGTGTYTGTSLAEQEGGGVQDCTENCTPPDPKATTNDQQCTANGSGGFTCTTSSSSSEFAASECTVGSVGGSTGYVCVQPDYVPESAAATKTDNTTVTQNPDGTTTTTVTSSTDNTYCSGGGCTTTTTTTTGSTTTDAAGNVLGKTEDCTGPNCAGPTDETKEEEPEEFTAPSAYTAPDASAAMPVLEEVPTYAETLASFKNRLGNAPLVAGLSNIAVPSGGSCDIGSASLFGGSISFNHFCEIAPSILSGLTYLFLSIWAWAAIRLFFTA